jgi:hypothetical protein
MGELMEVMLTAMIWYGVGDNGLCHGEMIMVLVHSGLGFELVG